MAVAAPDLAVLADPKRLAALRATGLLDGPALEDFDRVTRMAAELLDVPVVLVSLVDSERQFFLSRVGVGRPMSKKRETPLSRSFCQYVVAGEEPLVVTDARAVDWLRDNGAIKDLGIIAYVGFPLRAGDQPIGSFCAIDDRPREWSARELGMLRDFAAIVQTELDLRAARDEARQNSLMLGRLQRLTDATGGGAALEPLLEQLIGACVATFGAELVVIELLDGRGGLRRRAARGLADDRSHEALRIGEGFAGRVAASEQAISVHDLHAVEISDALRSSGARSLLAAPMIADERVQGAVYVGAGATDAFGEADRRLLALAADRFAAAIARADAYERDRLVARTLVAALQPARLPEVAGVRLAARYIPAERGLGGDWYDVFRLPAGSLGVAIGDVVGHGIEAAAEAVRLRTALRGAVLEGCTPADAVTALNRHATEHPGAYAGTVVYLELDAPSRRLRWSSAGHLPGVVACNGHGEWLGIADGPPLGVGKDDAFPGAERVLAPGSRVVLFTDGLIERRAELLDAGIDRVVAAAASAATVERACELALLQAPEPRFDDLALVALELE